MKPGVSMARATTLPQLSAICTARSAMIGSVLGPAITSTSFMSGAGLKKCMPTVRWGWPSESPSRPIESDEVLVAMMASSLSTGMIGRRAVTFVS